MSYKIAIKKITSTRWLMLLVLMLTTTLVSVPAVAAQEETTPTLTVLTATTAIRSGPGLNYPAFDTFEQGQTRGIIGYNAKTGWWQVISTFASPGWINGDDVSVNEAATRQFVSPESVAAPAVAANAMDTVSAQWNGLVFQSSTGGAIYTVKADDSNLRYLTTGLDPALSPDGTQVAFIRWDGSEFGTLYVINIDGTGERALMSGALNAKSPTWSADGEEIIISFQHGGLRDPKEICREFDFDDGLRMPSRSAQITKIRWGDDGLEICYIPKEDLRWGLRRVNVTTGQFEDLPNDLYSQSPTWNPTQSWQVVYDGARGLVSLDLNLGTSWALTEDANDQLPVISPDGTKIAVTYHQDNEHWDIQMMNIDGSERVRLTQTSYINLVEQEMIGQLPRSFNNVSPAWSPDGSQLVFATDRRGAWEIWLMNADGSNPQPLISAETLAEMDITLQFNGMNERMLSWR
jgi:uncharacterized protein YraI